MIQCFIKNEVPSIFENYALPKLISASKIDSHFRAHPRLLHSHEDKLEILFVRSGTGFYIVEEKKYPLQAGDIIICNEGGLHDDVPEHCQDLNTYCLTLTDVKITGLPKNCLIKKDACPHMQALECSDLLENLFSTVYMLLASDTEETIETSSFIACGIITLVYQIALRPKNELNYMDKKANLLSKEIKRYIDTHYNEDLTLKTIGDALHINPYYVAHVFKDNIGFSPIQYILHRRIGEAQSLLIHTEYSITTIASMVGYNNLSHFNSMFMKYVQMSPSEYRKNYTNKRNKKK